MKEHAFAEVIESSLSNFLAQSWQWDVFPEFGSLVQVSSDSREILGVVTEIQTGSMDPVRYPFPYQKTEEELRAEQPQIFEFLKTTFRVNIIGYEEAGKVAHVLAPKPCKIHAFVAPANKATMARCFTSPHFLHLLFAFESQIPSLDELLLATMKRLRQADLLKQNMLSDWCKTLSLLTGNDYRRLKLFLKRLETLS